MDSSVIGGIVRNVLAFGAGLLVAKGYGDLETWNTIIGAVVVFVTAAWSVIKNKKQSAAITEAAKTGVDTTK